MTIREDYEARERNMLAPYAVASADTRGRQRPVPPCSVRTEFQRDRDRIIHSKSFRRLKHKTQVFIAPEGDHYRTRLTHTLEVAQIARTIARALHLNEDLTEAIALGHDLGHTPFGHAGEAALDEIYLPGFRHNEQSLRVVDYLEGETGLNLTAEVRDGILKHTGKESPETLEGEVVRISDRIAYINHDIDDAMRAGIIRAEQIPKDCVEVLGLKHSERINTMVADMIQFSLGRPVVQMSPEKWSATMKLRDFLFQNVYLGSLAKTEETKVSYIIRKTYSYLLEHPEILGAEQDGTYDLERLAVDFLAGMTDRYAIRFFYEHFVPLPWAEV
ncbi:MAG: deoxyguanosinetriphosphate triphosphohydrolase [Solirubrobacterales bacterium]